MSRRSLCATVIPLTLAVVLSACEFDVRQPSSSVVVDSAEVAFQLAGPGGAAILIPVYINSEGPFDFVLDTGATLTCLAEERQTELQLPDRSTVGFGAGVGGTGQVQLVRADTFRVGGVYHTDLTVCVLDLANLRATGVNVDGLLGLNFLREHRVVLDFERNVASFD